MKFPPSSYHFISLRSKYIVIIVIIIIIIIIIIISMLS
jgi:hypothetical protein